MFSHDAEVGGEMNVKALVALEPALHSGMFVGRMVVHDQMNLLVLGSLALDQTQKLEPLAVAVFSQASSDHAAVECVERREQGGRAVAFVIVGHRLAVTQLPARRARWLRRL